MAEHQGGERCTVELEALSDGVLPTIRLRQFLKAALRTWRLKARSVIDTTPKLSPLPPAVVEQAEAGACAGPVQEALEKAVAARLASLPAKKELGA